MSNSLVNWRKWPFWLGAGILVLVLLIVLTWLFRIQIAENSIRNWCKSKALSCDVQIDSLGLSHANISRLSIRTAAGEIPFEAGKTDIGLAWPGLFRPEVTSIRVDYPVLRGRFDEDNSFSLGGLEKLTSGDSSSTQSPAFEITNARIELQTPAGPLALSGQARGQMPLQLEINAEIEPVELETDGNRLVVNEGRVDLALVGIKLSGSAEFDLAEVSFENLKADNVRLSANMADSLRPTLDWTATLGRFSLQDLSAKNTSLEGTIAVQRPANDKDETAPWPSRIRTASVEAVSQSLSWKETSAEAIELTLDTQRGNAKTLTTSYGLVISGLTRPDVRSEEMTATGTVTSNDTLSDVTATGDLSFQLASLQPAFRSELLSMLQIGGPFEQHSAALESALSQALTGMTGGTSLQLTRADGGYWSLVSTRAISIQSANGASASINPQNGHPVFNAADEATELSGLFTLTGPGLPKLVIDLTTARLSGSDIRVETGGLTLSPWTVNNLTIASELNELNFENAGGDPRLQTVGELRINGTLYGLTLGSTRLFGGIEAAGGSSLRVQTYRTRCLGFDTDGIDTANGYSVDAVSLQLCPRDGRIVRPVAGGSGGTFDLGALSLPFEGGRTSGTLSLEKAVLDWAATSTARLVLIGEQMSLPLDIGDKTLTVNSASPSIAFETKRPASLKASLGASQFAGSLVPADIGIDQITIDWTLPASGIQGTGLAKGVEIRDRGEDPLYVPLRGDLNATFSDGIMSLTGPITTRPAGRTIANVEMELDILSLDGTASVLSPDLTFEPRRFQPTALSERVRGFLSNARGTLRASADFDIRSGQPSGTGWVSVEDFGFDTLRLGAVNGVNGRIDFSDIMSLSTSPGQEIRIGEINPGIPLQNGRLRFQLTNAVEARLEEMRWPFAGGELISGGSDWTIAGTRDVVEITAQSLELSDLVAVFNIPDLKAEGTVSGTFPVEFVNANTFIRNASLTADSSGGTIAYTGAAGAQAAKADERVSMAFEALKDFDFTVLELNADGNLAGDILITMRLIGESPKVLGGAPFAFNIGIDSKLMQLIRTGRSVTTSDWLAQVVADTSSTSSGETTAPEQ